MKFVLNDRMTSKIIDRMLMSHDFWRNISMNGQLPFDIPPEIDFSFEFQRSGRKLSVKAFYYNNISTQTMIPN